VELAGDINLSMPRHVVDLVAEALNEHGRALRGSCVGVLGVAFKPNVRDPRNSPAAEIISGLTARGTEIIYHDPHVDHFTAGDGISRESTTLDDLLATADVVVVVTAHRDIDWAAVYDRA